MFKEALDDVVYLPEADPETFDVFLEWVYTKVVRFPKWPVDKTSLSECEAWWHLVTRLYLLADYLQCTSFGNALLDRVSRIVVRGQIDPHPSYDTTILLYKSTTGHCGMRKLFVALWVWKTSQSQFAAKEDEWRAYFKGLPEEFLSDLVVKLQKKNHELEQDPFANEKTCQIFRDTVIGSQVVATPNNETNKASSPVQK